MGSWKDHLRYCKRVRWLYKNLNHLVFLNVSIVWIEIYFCIIVMIIQLMKVDYSCTDL